MSRVLVVGASGHAKVVLDILEQEGRHEVAGLLDDFKPPGTAWYCYQVVGPVADVAEIAAQTNANGLFVAIGDNWIRSQIVERLKSLVPQLTFVSPVHPSARLARGVTLGGGSVVMAGAVINSDSILGEHCIVNTNASVDHDNHLGQFSSLAPRAATGGNVTIGDFSAIGIGATILHGRRIGQHSVIGASSLVTRDVPDFTVAYGLTAKAIRSRTAGEKYL